jgi:serine/threonine protein phosphatase PrpC
MPQIKASSICYAGKYHDESQDSFLTGSYVPDMFAFEMAKSRSIGHTLSVTVAKQTSCLAVFDCLGCPAGAPYSESPARLAAEALKAEVSRMLLLPLEYVDALMQRYANQQNEMIRLSAPAAGKAPGVSFAILCLRGNQAVVYSIGNCRVFLWREGQLKQLTVVYPGGNPARPELPRYYLGMPAGGKNVHFDTTGYFDLQDYDRFLLCSGSLPEILDETVLRACLGRDDPQLATTQLIAAVQGKDGLEPVTVTIGQWHSEEMPHPVHVAGADQLQRKRHTTPHVEHKRQEFKIPEVEKPKIDPDKIKMNHFDFWTTMPAWIQIVGLVGLLGLLLLLFWLLGPQIFG